MNHPFSIPFPPNHLDQLRNQPKSTSKPNSPSLTHRTPKPLSLATLLSLSPSPPSLLPQNPSENLYAATTNNNNSLRQHPPLLLDLHLAGAASLSSQNRRSPIVVNTTKQPAKLHQIHPLIHPKLQPKQHPNVPNFPARFAAENSPIAKPLSLLRRSSSLSLVPSFRRSSSVSVSKPVYVSSVEGFGSLKRSNEKTLVECKAYEADRAEPIEGSESKTKLPKRLKIGVYFATWWFLNVIINIYNKKVLNAFPFPWLISTLSLAAGSLIMLISWALRIAESS